jgi:hypothetical protein
LGVSKVMSAMAMVMLRPLIGCGGSTCRSP